MLPFRPDCSMGALSDSISAWLTIDPHLLFYIFLPALIFGSAFSVGESVPNSATDPERSGVGIGATTGGV